MVDSISTGLAGDTMLSEAAAAVSMNDIYRYQRYIYDATRRYFLLGRLHLIENLSPPEKADILEVGCGTAWNLIRAARTYPQAQLYGFDISTEMLDTAANTIDREGLRHRISLAQGDATSFNTQNMFARTTFDRIFISYALSMIPGWVSVLKACEVALADGGEIHLVDFGQCEGLPITFRRLLFAWLEHFSVSPRTRLKEQLEHLVLQKNLEIEYSKLYRGYADYAILRRP